MKVLNLDQIEKANRTLVLNGKTYDVPPMSVENFITTTRKSAEMSKREDMTIADQIEETVEMIARSIPTIDKKILTSISLEYLEKIMSFVRDDAPEKADSPADAKAAEEAAEEGTAPKN